MEQIDGWGGPPRMTAWEALMWRADGDPRTRSTGILLEILERAPDIAAFRSAHERAVARIPRLRDRVVEPPVAVTEPHWSADPEFDLDRHLRVVTLSEPAGDESFLAFVEQVFAEQVDRRRPPWEAILVTGLAEGRAAYLLKVHHAMSDGLGLMQLLALTQSTTPHLSTESVDTVSPVGERWTPGGLLAEALSESIKEAPAWTRQALGTAAAWAGRSLRDPRGTGAHMRSIRRLLSPPGVERSSLLAGTGTGTRLLFLDVPLADLKRGANAAGGTVNDGFVAAMLGGMRRYHEVHGAAVPSSLPLGLPVSLRSADDHAGGNNFTGAHIVAPLAEVDAAERIRLVRGLVRAVRGEPALGVIGDLATVLAKLPTQALVALAANLTTTSDLQVSNIRGSAVPTYLAGVKVLGMYPLGPRPGVAVMAAMISYAETCCLGFHVDPDVFPDVDGLRACLEAGFDEVIALADDGEA